MPPSAKLLRQQIIQDVSSVEPIAPRCAYAPPNDFCGGCVFQDRPYEAQIQAKQRALRRMWEELLNPQQLDQIGFAGSPQPLGYRTRMDYVTSKERMGLRRSGKFNYIIDLTECHLLSPEAFQATRATFEYTRQLGLPDYNLRSHEGFLRYLTVRRSPDNQFLLAAVTASTAYADEMEQLAAFALAQSGVVGFHWLLNEHVADSAFGTTQHIWGAETLDMQVGGYTLVIGPNTFFQNNIYLLDAMLEEISSAVQHSSRAGSDGTLPLSVADLYGGVGLIGMWLSPLAHEVVSVESVAESVALARQNISLNQITNLQLVESDVAAYLAEQSVGRFDVIVADPPRSGLGEQACAELLRLRPRRIVYVSCNPLTQVEDARLLFSRYQLTSLRGYDMFPQTPHMESLAIFDRKPAPGSEQGF